MAEPLSTAMPAARRDPRLGWYVLALVLAGGIAMLAMPRPVRNPALAAMFAALGVANLLLSLLSLRARRDAGLVLLDLGPPPQRTLATLGLIGAALIVAAAVMAAARGLPVTAFDAALVLFFGTHAVQAIVTRSARLQLREHGLLLGTSYVPWPCIRGWAWTSEKSVAFVGSFPWLLRGEARLDLDDADPPREAVERVLRDHIPVGA